MTQDTITNKDIAARTLVISRLVNAPRELVWQVWTDPEHIAQWWGPNGFTNTIHKMDVRAGGEWSYIMHGPDGKDWPNHVAYKEVVKYEKLVYAHGSGIENDPEAFDVIVTFEQQGDKTFITMRSLFQSAEIRNMVMEKYGAVEGGNQTLNKLEIHLLPLHTPDANKEFVITRVINAPRELVFSAMTEPKHLMHWWGPKGFKMMVADMDLREGGTLHYGLQAPDGSEMWGRLTYREITHPGKMVLVVSFSDKEGNIVRNPYHATWPLEVLNIITLTEEDGKIVLQITGGPVNASEQEIQTFYDNRPSMQQGFKGTFDQLDEYLATIN